MTIYVVAVSDSQLKEFNDLLHLAGEHPKLLRLYMAEQLYGTRPDVILILPKGLKTLKVHDRDRVLAYCSRHNIPVSNITASKLANLEALVKQEGRYEASQTG